MQQELGARQQEGRSLLDPLLVGDGERVEERDRRVASVVADAAGEERGGERVDDLARAAAARPDR